MNIAHCTRYLVVALALVGLPAVAQVQGYPARPITLVVGYAPGGATDTLARAVAEKLQSRLSQPVLVDNKPGASTAIATAFVRQATPDGHTLYLVSSQFGQLPVVCPSLGKYDPAHDFTSVARLSSILAVLVANPKLPANSIPELLELAKSKPGQLTIATTGLGSPDHLAVELLAHKTGTKFNLIPYKGAAPAIQDVVAGVADLRLDAMPTSRGFIETGKLKALAIFDRKRHPSLPAIPAIDESIAGADFRSYFGVIGPKGMPPAIVARLNKELLEIMATPDFSARMAALGLETSTGSPEQFGAVIQNDTALGAKLLKDTGLKIEQ